MIKCKDEWKDKFGPTGHYGGGEMKKFLCWLICAVMLFTAAACGKTPERTMPDTTTEPETTVPETEAPKTDKDAKADDVIKEALKALLKDDLKFGFTSDTALDLSLLRAAEESKAAQSDGGAGMNDMLGMIVGVIFGDKNELNLKLDVKAEGSADAQKGMAAKIELKNNAAEALEGLFKLLNSQTEDGESPVSWLKDTFNTEVYMDKAEGKAYFLNPVTEEWNFTEARFTEDEDAEKTIDELELEKFFGKDYEWKITDTQYLFSADVDLKELALSTASEEERKETEDEMGGMLDGLVLHVAMTFNDEKKLESAEISLDPFTKDLSMFLNGISLRLNRFEIKCGMDYAAAVDCEVPAAVKESAVEAESGSILPIGPGTDDPFGLDEDEFPWANDDYSLKDEVLADDENVRLTANKVQTDEFGDIHVLFTLENKTDKKLNIDLDDLYVNGLKTNAFVYEEVGPQTSLELDLEIYDLSMNAIHQEHIYQMDLFFLIEDAEDWMADPVLEDHFTLNVQPGEAEPWEQDTAMTLLETEDLKAVWLPAGERDEILGMDLYVFCENGKDIPVSFEITDLKVNGTEVDKVWLEDEFKGGLAGVYKLALSAEFMEKNEIAEITEVTGTIRAYSEDDNWNEVEYAVNEFTVTYQADGSVSLETAAAE